MTHVSHIGDVRHALKKAIFGFLDRWFQQMGMLDIEFAKTK